MSKRAWMLVGLALGGGILLQIPSWGGHDHETMTGMTSARMASEEASAGTAATQRTVALDVTGMT